MALFGRDYNNLENKESREDALAEIKDHVYCKTYLDIVV